MSNNYKKALVILLFGLFANVAGAQTLIHYWNFNNLPNGTLTNAVTADYSLITGTTSITYPGTGNGYVDRVNSDATVNAQNGDVAGYGLRPRNPSNTRSLVIAFPTTGYENVVVAFATTRTGSGATEQNYSYSLDGGTTYTNAGLGTVAYNPEEDVYNLVTLDFSGIEGADNNPDFIVKINFGGDNASGDSGNNRFDNITVKANVIGGILDTTVAMQENFMVVNEDAGTINFMLDLTNPAVGSVDVVVKPAPFSTADSNDFTVTTQTLNFTATSSTEQTISIQITDDTEIEQKAEYFVISLENPQGLSIEGDSFATIYIKDNDVTAPVPNQDIQMEYVMSFDPSGENNSTCEIVVYDPVTKRLFATSAVEGRFDIIDFSNPEAPSTISSVDMNTYGGVTSVAVMNGIVAVASPNANEQLDGTVVFFDTNGTFIKQVGVGALPDNVSFSPDGTKVLTANEGQPSDDYTVDPEGSVSIIDITGGIENLTDANVNTLFFTAYNGQEETLWAQGVRKVKATSTLSQDFEPEYITCSDDSAKAWVALQENNAIAEIDLTTGAISSVWGLGTKDMSLPGNGFDISDKSDEILIANWPVNTFFTPDGIGHYSVNGTNYIVTANEGDEKDYSGFSERTTIGDESYNLDATAFPQAEMLKNKFNAGRLRVTNVNGMNDAGTAYEEIYGMGARSFSIFNADTGEMVFDSGDDFEMYTAEAFTDIFNADNEDNEQKGRSRAKGPEPEGIAIAQMMGRTFAIIGLERIGGVMVYDITDPDDVTFVDYKNPRSVSAYGGDNGPEGIIFISETDSPDETPYVIVANEISGTLTIYSVNTENLGTENFTHKPASFVVFPNPSVAGVVYFNRAADIEVYDYSGKMVHSAKQALTIDTAKLATGMYLIKTSEGIVKKLLIQQ
ncbi:choice-of-anchor I family protein [Flavobacterium rhizosphaerae]|uniref:Choice-of-anchor I family protein n=1 Tax=Flavobacterium rhizosphaerae TaxID=3163298 RepID=A0ABW8YY68_9FLAO